jgi:hypothetical protein
MLAKDEARPIAANVARLPDIRYLIGKLMRADKCRLKEQRGDIYVLTSLVSSLANNRVGEKRRCAPDKQKKQNTKKGAVLIHELRCDA